MSALIGFLAYVFWFGVVLGVAVFFHELGHFLAAKWVGVRVVCFSLGFGTRIWGFVWRGTEYRLSAFPLGGYVRMAGDNPEEGLEGRPDEFLSVSPWRRMLIVFAGPAANVVTAVACFLAVGLVKGEAYYPYRTVESVIAGSPAERAGLRTGDRILAVRGEPVDTFEEIQGLLRRLPDDPETPAISVRVERADAAVPAGTREVEARVVLDDPLAYYSGYTVPPSVGSVEEDGPAARAGVAAGDTILAVSGAPVASWGELVAQVRPRYRARPDGGYDPEPFPLTWAGESGAATTALVIPRVDLRQTSAGATAPVAMIGIGQDTTIRQMVLPQLELPTVGLTIGWPPVVGRVARRSPAQAVGMQRGDVILSIDGQLVRSISEVIDRVWDAVDIDAAGRAVPRRIEVSWRGRDGVVRQERVEVDREQIPHSFKQGAYTWRGSLGIDPAVEWRQLGIVGSLRYAMLETWDSGAQFVFVLKGILFGRVSSKHLVGPVGIFKMSGDMGKRGWDYVLRFIGLICVNLALLNLFPIPVLDGGHLLLYAIEAVRRRPWTMRQLEIATWIGLVPILLLLVLVFYNDLYRLFGQLRF